MTDSLPNPRMQTSSPHAPHQRVLVVEDNAEIAKLLTIHLTDMGLAVEHISDGAAGLQAGRSGSWDLIVLDLMLPGLDGLEICRQLRSNPQLPYVPILMLTAKASEIDRVVGLEMGADDYLAKPFSMPELQARVKALLRRSQRMAAASQSSASATHAAADTKQTITAGALKIDVAGHGVTLNGATVNLTAKEFDLLLHFAQHPGRVFTRTQLLDAVWGTTLAAYEYNVNTHINRLRSKLEADPAQPHYVLTVRGVGYKFNDKP